MAVDTTTKTTLVRAFRDRSSAQSAVNEIKKIGIKDSEIGIITRDGDDLGTGGAAGTTGADENRAPEGAMVGAATGAGVGALWAVGIAAGLLPAIGPVIAGGIFASIVASAAGAAAVGGIVGALVGLGIPEDEAEYYESEVKSGRTIVTVSAGNRNAEAMAILQRHGGYDMRGLGHDTTQTAAIPQAATRTTDAAMPSKMPAAQKRQTTPSGETTIELHEEELHARKSQVQTGEVRVHKDIVTEHKTIEVPVSREEVVIERRPASGKQVAGDLSNLGNNEEIRIPVKEEHVHLEKTVHATEEVTVGKRKTTDTEVVSGDVKREELHVQETGDVLRSQGTAQNAGRAKPAQGNLPSSTAQSCDVDPPRTDKR